MLTKLWRHKISNEPYLFNQAVSMLDQKIKTKTSISWEQKELLSWNKKQFSSFLKGFQLPKIFADLECAFNDTLKENLIQDSVKLLAASDLFDMFRSNHRRCSVKKVLMESSQNWQENTCVSVSFLIKLQALGLQLY